MILQPIYQILPYSLRERIQSLPRAILGGLEEIRIRQDRPLEVIAAGKPWFVTQRQQLSISPHECVRPTREDCQKILNLISRHSLYALEEELRRGYVTIEGGHRIGLAGKVVLEQSQVKYLREITCFNIRIARQVLGVAENLLPYLIQQDKVENVLLVAPPQCGKTTIIRDLARLASTGGTGFCSFKVGIVDERSEIAGCVGGIPQHDVGPRTDVLDGCPKAEGMMMMIRSMSPEIIVVDEIGREEDSQAVHEAICAGVHLFATAHGSSLKEIRQRPILANLLQSGVFSRIVVLSRRLGLGTVEAIYDQHLRPLRGITCLN